ncbi:MAG: DUF177 domain-containing protein [Actinomycetia bacterium]|nr:DUF177 domain-containing protein [Actinomycetes bacterium]
MDDGLRIPLAVLRRRVDPRLVRRTVELDDLGVGEVRVVDGRVDVDLEAEARGPDVVVTGSVGAAWVGECRRCLDEVGGRLDLRVHEVLSAGSGSPSSTGSGDEGSVGDSGDAYPLGGDEADVEPIVRDAVLLAIPLSPLCSEDCAGPDPERFPAATFGSGEAEGDDLDAAPVADPRWAALDALRAPGDADS